MFLLLNFMHHFEIFKCFYDFVKDKRDWCEPLLSLIIKGKLVLL